MSVDDPDQNTPVDFPFLTADEFSAACCCWLSEAGSEWSTKFKGDCHVTMNRGPDARSSDMLILHTGEAKPKVKFVQIVRSLHGGGRWQTSNREIQDTNAYYEQDDELIQPTDGSLTCCPLIEYHVLLSPSYQVPMLYFSMRNLPSPQKSSIDLLHELVIPPEYKSQVRDAGVIGAITFGDHPITNMPAFFIHPCNTADALRELSCGLTITIENYLDVWLGVIGKFVGLDLHIAQTIK